MAGEMNFGIIDAAMPGRIANSFYQGQQEQAQNALMRAQLEHATGANRLSALQYQQAQRAMQEDEDTKNALMGSGGDLSVARNALMSKGLYKPALAIQKSNLENLKTNAEIDEKTAATLLKRKQVLGGALVAAHADPSDATLLRVLDSLEAEGIPTTKTRAAFAQIQDPEQRRQLIKSYAFGTPEGRQALESIQVKAEKVDAGGQIGFVNINPLAGQIGTQTGPAIGKTMTPNETAMLPIHQGQLNVARQNAGTSAGQLGVAQQRLAKDMDVGLQGRIAQAKAVGTTTGEGQAKAASNLPGAIATADQAVKMIDELVGSKDGKIKPHPGLQTAVGATITPGLKYVPGTDTASFMARFDQIKGQAFLQAFEALKGGGQITEIEGAKGTAAINRMNTATSEKEFVQAAREAQAIYRKGVQNAKVKAGAAKANDGWTIEKE